MPSEGITQQLQSQNKQQPSLLSREPSPSPLGIDPSLHTPDTPPAMGTPTKDLNNSWSSAVGRATTGGKSGRVIERLMHENDRLLREKKLATVKLEEELKRGESARSALESLQISNENLVSMHESDANLLIKRDRRIQELREDLEYEKARREKADKETRESRRERDETVERIRREANEDKELSRRATSQYDVLSSSWKKLEERYDRQMQALKTDVNSLRFEMDSDKEKLAQLEIITEQLKMEEKKTRKAKEKLTLGFHSYKEEREASIRSIRDNARLNVAANDEAQHRMEVVLGEMKHVVNVKKDVRNAE